MTPIREVELRNSRSSVSLKHERTANLFTIIDAADDAGIYAFDVEKRWLPYDLPRSGNAALIGLIESEFYDQALPTLRLSQVRRFVDQIDCLGYQVKEAVDGAGVGDWHVEFNLAKLLQLPGLEPKAELLELRGFLDACKPLFEREAKVEERDRTNPCTPDIQIKNVRERSGRVDAQFDARVRNGLVNGTGMVSDKEFTQHLRSIVAGSESLTHMMRQVALTLQKIGPWSWVCIDEDDLYGERDGPNYHAWEEARTARLAAEELEAPRADGQLQRPRERA